MRKLLPLTNDEFKRIATNTHTVDQLRRAKPHGDQGGAEAAAKKAT